MNDITNLTIQTSHAAAAAAIIKQQVTINEKTFNDQSHLKKFRLYSDKLYREL